MVEGVEVDAVALGVVSAAALAAEGPGTILFAGGATGPTAPARLAGTLAPIVTASTIGTLPATSSLARRHRPPPSRLPSLLRPPSS